MIQLRYSTKLYNHTWLYSILQHITYDIHNIIVTNDIRWFFFQVVTIAHDIIYHFN